MSAEKKTIVIERFVENSEQKTYIRIPFEMPADVERVDISYFYDDMEKSSLPLGEKNVIDLAVLDQEGKDVGATGSSYKNISFGEVYSSPGYKKLKLVEGTWHIVLGAYLIREKGVNVKYEITFYFKRYRWFKGDPHLHSINSDGKFDYAAVAKIASKKGLDFAIITDHNNTADGAMPKMNGLTVMKGVELTNYFGHINYWGKEKPYSESYAANSFEEFLSLNNEAKQNGALRVLNHPRCSLCPWVWPTDFEYEGIEVWNGPMRQDNLNAIELWESKLKDGKKVFATGGSDFHKFKFMMANPTIAVYAKSAAQDDILDAFLARRAVVLYGPKAPMLDLSCGDAGVGDIVKLSGDEKKTVEVSCENLKKGQVLVVLNQQGEVYRHKSTSSKPFSAKIPVNDATYIRAEVRYKKKHIFKLIYKLFMKIATPKFAKDKIPMFVYSLTNPIFFERN